MSSTSEERLLRQQLWTWEVQFWNGETDWDREGFERQGDDGGDFRRFLKTSTLSTEIKGETVHTL